MEGIVILRACRDSVWPRSKFGIDNRRAYERDHVRCRLRKSFRAIKNLSACQRLSG